MLGLLIRAEIGDIRRFPTPGHLASYAGLVPRVDASAGRVRYGRITRRGSPWLRWALVEAAMHGAEADRSRLAAGAGGSAIRKGALKARVALRADVCATTCIGAGSTTDDVLSRAGPIDQALTTAWSFRE